ncbi:uncharacterized protein LOC126669737 [Mercurialis annua]|uniref:uncharacterized protein LOC126669737 n=1 Tax=Mercurialis annua TaxID=3986 RepID=UPI002160D9E0|nr:uncharacterized protein LOC126669737 [Mercurialis annua]
MASSEPPLPLHLCFFVLTLVLLISVSCYINYEPVVEAMFDQVKLLFMVSPLLILCALHLLSNDQNTYLLGNLSERDSPWGVAFSLVFLFFMISYHSSFQQLCFPLLTR